MEIKVECSKCGQHVLVDDWSMGQTFACPTCGQSLTVPTAVPTATEPAPPRRPVPTKEIQTNVKQGAALGGWVCFGLGSVFMFIPVPTWFIYGPLFLASFILSIVAISQRRIASGVTLLLANVLGAPILFIIALLWPGAFEQARHRAAEYQKTHATNQVSPDVKASEPEAIEGAFGKKLGEVFNPASAMDTSKLTDGTPLYEFSTPNGFRSFTRYYVMITPTTHRIYSIWGIGSIESTQAGQKEQAVIMELLKQKYGTDEKQGLFDTMGDVKRIDQGNRHIITKISGFTDVTLDLRYYDGDLEKLAEKERLASEVQNADKTGL